MKLLRDLLTTRIDVKKGLQAYVAWASEPVPSIESKLAVPAVGALGRVSALRRSAGDPLLTGDPLAAVRRDDGRLFEEAWNQGWPTLWTPYSGYLNTIPRLVSLVAVRLPLNLAPALVTWVAIAIQAGVAAGVIGRRAAAILPSDITRLALASALVIYPGYIGVIGNLAHAQWFLAVWGLVLVLSPRPATAWGIAFDALVLALISVCGPFGLLMMPMALWRWRERWPAALALLPGSVCQVVLLLGAERIGSTGHHRFATVVGMLANKVYGEVVSYPPDLNHSVSLDYGELACASIVALLVAALLWRGPTLVKALAALSVLCFLMALASSATWYALGELGRGDRYFMLLGVTVAVGLVHFGQVRSWRLPRIGLQMVWLLFAFSTISGWVPTRYYRHAYEAIYRDAPPGVVTIQISSAERPWYMNLRKPKP